MSSCITCTIRAQLHAPIKATPLSDPSSLGWTCRERALSLSAQSIRDYIDESSLLSIPNLLPASLTQKA
jgi:hypothetical protein